MKRNFLINKSKQKKFYAEIYLDLFTNTQQNSSQSQNLKEIYDFIGFVCLH